MDLNYLFHRQQVSLMMAAAANGVEAQRAHSGLARAYGVRIDRVRASGGVSFPLRGL